VGRDPLAVVLRDLLGQHGVDTSRLVSRPDVQTSASVLPVRPNGDRPAWHCVGANGTVTLDDLDLTRLGEYDVVHLGGPEFLGGEAAAELLRTARDAGAITSVDLLAPGDPDMLEWVGACLPHVDHLLPNDEQLRGFTGLDDLTDAAAVLLDRGVGCVAVTCGAQGALVVSEGGADRVPAFEVEVVDTTGCGDAFSAGFLMGVAGGRTLVEAAVLGNAAAAQVVGGVGTDAGSYDLASVDDFAVRTPTR
jgi:sugar/nucleoside kinase (ribokinase family)